MREYDILVIGGGPAGINAALSASRKGLRVLLAEEKEFLGGQLIKQTHKFFGSKDEYAGTRGIQIVREFIEKINNDKNIDLMLSAMVMGYYEDGVVTILKDERMFKIKPKKVIVATGAFERSLPFENNDLPGIFGAGAVQTLMNVYGILPGKEVLMVGSGNIGLIVSYQLTQAGVKVKGIVEISEKIGGYLVHASKIRRLGIPIYTSYTIIKALGGRKVEGAIIENVKTHEKKEIKCDVVCLATGLSPLGDILNQMGCEMMYIPELGGFVPVRDDNLKTTIDNIFVAGDVAGIEEATAAMLEGELAGLYASYELTGEFDKRINEIKNRLAELRKTSTKIVSGLKKLNLNVDFIIEEQEDLDELHRNGIPEKERIESVSNTEKAKFAVIECFQKIPCNPCVVSCPTNAIKMDTLNGLPKLEYDLCTGCGNCIGVCPGLAIFVVDKKKSSVFLPYEMLPLPEKGEKVDLLNRKGEKIADGKVLSIRKLKDKTNIVEVEVPKELIMEVRNIEVMR
ncbi:FAD-dependent pyridine nucleotide-disulfide oxidoreductase [Marinitoga sp. 1197]|uniref:FAD-dependent oxidoreductase n=1 Tax=Marinitoga sp. 1197 TaxID=1428449 RepID=UPI000640FF15|nr:FAD-dependent oxidoreductase [Marinitoga sp. 1197]KLO21080.1 FAD-dependent pyridine nucleotide-disulfide oxidoreductase [Marinitoga sp. 1197]